MTQIDGLLMKLRKNSPIPDNNHIIRYISPNKLRKDENDNIIGILGEAFKLRDGEASLSANHLEHFSEPHNEQITHAVKEFRKHFNAKPNAGFAIGQVCDIKQTCLTERNIKIYIVSSPTKKYDLEGNPYKNESHVDVKSIPSDDTGLLDLLANEAWGHLVLNKAIPI